MKLHEASRYIEENEFTQQSKQFVIEASAKAFHMMMDKLYTNKTLAVIREATQNAYDAHLLVECDKPIRVTIPTAFTLNFSVKDFGPGMSHEFMMDGYTKVTHSTKNKTDTSVGGLGIGRLSMFSVCDTYTVSTIHRGIKRLYTVFLDEARIPTIALTYEAEAKPDEAGTEVSIPVHKNDVYKFHHAAKQALAYFPQNSLEVVNIELEPVQYRNKAKFFGIRKGSPFGMQIIMGPIAYPLVNDIISKELSRNNLGLFSNLSTIDIFATVGEMDVTPNREALDYNKRTIQNIISRLQLVKREIDDYVSAIASETAAPFEAYCKLNALYDMRLIEYSKFKELAPDYTFANSDIRFGYRYMGKTRLKWEDELTFYRVRQHVQFEEGESEKDITFVVMDTRKISAFKVALQFDPRLAIAISGAQPEIDKHLIKIEMAFPNAKFVTASSYIKSRTAPNKVIAPVIVERKTPRIIEFARGIEWDLDELSIEVEKESHSKVCWVPSKRKCPEFLRVLDSTDLRVIQTHLLNPVYGSVRIFLIPISYTKATRWAEDTLLHAEDLVTSAACRVWADSKIRKQLRQFTGNQEFDLLANSKVFKFMTYHQRQASELAAHKNKDSLFATAHKLSIEWLHIQNNYEHFTTLKSMLEQFNFSTEKAFAPTREDLKLFKIEPEVIERYPTIQAHHERMNDMHYYSRDQYPPHLLSDYIRLTEAIHDE